MADSRPLTSVEAEDEFSASLTTLVSVWAAVRVSARNTPICDSDGLWWPGIGNDTSMIHKRFNINIIYSVI